jgi:AMP nucleosidase
MNNDLTPEAAVERLIVLHREATGSLKTCLDRYFDTRVPPTDEERRSFCYPELRVDYRAAGIQPRIARAYAKFQGPGTYATTVTHPDHFGRYLIEQLRFLVKDYGAAISVEHSEQEIPYPYVLDQGDDLGRNGVTAAELALYFPAPKLAHVGDEVADGMWEHRPGHPLPLACSTRCGSTIR